MSAFRPEARADTDQLSFSPYAGRQLSGIAMNLPDDRHGRISDEQVVPQTVQPLLGR